MSSGQLSVACVGAVPDCAAGDRTKATLAFKYLLTVSQTLVLLSPTFLILLLVIQTLFYCMGSTRIEIDKL